MFPTQTVMVVLDADRFGIAQLHQLRGRVGRGEHASTCWLMTTSEDANPRIEALVASTDGFELAEIDLELRGEGTLMSSAQKGRSDLRLASLRRDRELIEQAREVAFRIIDDDPELAQSDVLRSEVTSFRARRRLSHEILTMRVTQKSGNSSSSGSTRSQRSRQSSHR